MLANLELCEKHLETAKQFLTGGLINSENSSKKVLMELGKGRI